ncbi:MAG TPA: membrane protein insertion efficiency factor YidD [Victivallales bacterium]|nr:membrane protein insertion efficiency factor YidD [Victivallales bacterium]
MEIELRKQFNPVCSLAIFCVKSYKRIISPFLPRMCRYNPSCSEYMAEALEKHGLLKGLAMGVFRIARCNPWCDCGNDPVPVKFQISRNRQAD